MYTQEPLSDQKLKAYLMMSEIGHGNIRHPVGSDVESRHAYICAHCSKQVSGAVVAYISQGAESVKWLWCTHCGNGSVLTVEGNVYPGASFGPEIEGLPDDVRDRTRYHPPSSGKRCRIVARIHMRSL